MLQSSLNMQLARDYLIAMLAGEPIVTPGTTADTLALAAACQWIMWEMAGRAKPTPEPTHREYREARAQQSLRDVHDLVDFAGLLLCRLNAGEDFPPVVRIQVAEVDGQKYANVITNEKAEAAPHAAGEGQGT